VLAGIAAVLGAVEMAWRDRIKAERDSLREEKRAPDVTFDSLSALYNRRAARDRTAPAEEKDITACWVQ